MGIQPLPQEGGGAPQFSAHVYCGQTAAWIKMPLDSKLGLGPDDCVTWGPNSPSQKGGIAPSPMFGSCLLWQNSWMDQGDTWHGGGPWSRPHCAKWEPSSPPQKGGRATQFSAHFYCGQTAGCINMPLGMEVGLSPGDFVFDGAQLAPEKQAHSPDPIFGPCLLWPNG